MIRPRQVVEAWVEAFNRGDAAALAAMYREDAEVVGGLIAFQRGYWDKLSFLKLHGLEQSA